MVNMISFRVEFGLILVGAIIVTASLMWKDLFSEIGEHIFPKTNGLGGRTLYTLIITVILLMFAVFLKDLWNIKSTSEVIPIKSDPTQNYVHVSPKDEEQQFSTF